MSTRARLFEASASGLVGSGAIPSHITTLAVGYVLFQVFTIDFVATDSLRLAEAELSMGPPLDEALVRLWPASRTMIRWPGAVFVDRASLRMVVRGHV